MEYMSDKQNEKLLDIESDPKSNLELKNLNMNISPTKNGVAEHTNIEHNRELHQLFGNLNLEMNKSMNDTKQTENMKTKSEIDIDKSLSELDLAMDVFDICDAGFNLTDLSSIISENQNIQGNQPLQLLTSENAALLNDIINDKDESNNSNNEWDTILNDTFLPPNILKQSLGDATLGIGQKGTQLSNTDDKKKGKTGKNKGNSWLDLFAELDPLANNPMESLGNDGNASV